MNLFPYLLSLSNGIALERNLRPWLTLGTFPFSAAIEVVEYQDFESHSCGYTITSETAIMKVGAHVQRHAYTRLRLYMAHQINPQGKP